MDRFRKEVPELPRVSQTGCSPLHKRNNNNKKLKKTGHGLNSLLFKISFLHWLNLTVACTRMWCNQSLGPVLIDLCYLLPNRANLLHNPNDLRISNVMTHFTDRWAETTRDSLIKHQNRASSVNTLPP